MKHTYLAPQSKLVPVETAGILALSDHDGDGGHNDGNFEEITRRKGTWDAASDDDAPFWGGTPE